MNNTAGTKRGLWSTRTAFILAAIGSAVGLGNLWGFPYKLYTYGGGAFLIPYFIAMAVMGIPLLIMEFSVGHWSRQSPPEAFARIGSKHRYVGWWLVTLAFVIITYYTVILGYCVVYLVESIWCMLGDLPWSGGAEEAGRHFDSLLGREKGTLAIACPNWPVFVGMIASWAMIYLCLFRGVKWVSKVVLLTVPLPWLMLVILTVRGLTLPGAETGLKFYLEPNWGKLAEADTWRVAFGQVFFSMSLGFAVMLCYASFLKKKSDLNNNALVIGLGDLATSFVAGIAVFSTLGAMAMADDKAVECVVDAGPGLTFATFPYALSKLPAYQGIFSAVFFVALLTLGIDSAFSIVEACMSSVCDSKPKWPRKWVLPAICGVGALVGILYCCSRGGLDWLYLVDDLINGPMGILVVALAECLVAGWAWKGAFVKKMREHSNEQSDWKLGVWWDIVIKYVAPVFLVLLIGWSVSDFVKDRKIPQLIGSGAFALVPVACWILMTRSRKGAPEGEKNGKLIGSLVWGLPTAAVITGVIIGCFRLRPEAAAAEQAVKPFIEGQLGLTAYIVLGVAAVVIVGGLLWCYSRARTHGKLAANNTEDSEEQE